MFGKDIQVGSERILRICGVFVTFFTVFPREPFADTLVIVFFVHWQTLAVVLTGPASAGCLQKNRHYDARFKVMCVAASYKLATELSVWEVYAVGNFICDNNDARQKKSLKSKHARNCDNLMAVRYKFASKSAGEQGYNWTDRCFVDLENERFTVKEHN